MSIASSGWPPQPAPTYPPPPIGARRTEPFAIVALVCSLGGLLVCPPVPGIVGIVFGYLALGRIRRSGDAGREMAIAGLVVGSITVVLALVAAVAFAVFSGVFLAAQDRSTDHAVASARTLGTRIRAVARREEIPTRDTRTVRLAVRESGLDPEAVSVGFFGGSALTVSRGRLAHEGWHLHVSSGLSGGACLTVPRTTSGIIRVTRDLCPEP